MFWIFAAVVLILCIASKGFLKVVLGGTAFIAVAGFMLINEDVKKHEAMRAKQAIERNAEPVRKATFDDLLED